MNTWTCSVACNDNKATARSIQFDANDVIIITAPLRLSKKLHSLPSSLGRIIQSRGRTCVDPWPSRREIYGNSLHVSALIYACVLELIASRMQPVISTTSQTNCEKRVSTLEKKLK